MFMVDIDPLEVDRLLATGRLCCSKCAGLLRPWGYARWRTIRHEHDLVPCRPRRGCCSGCGPTHVLLPVSGLSRRADGSP